jgi:hypothetical protein
MDYAFAIGRLAGIAIVLIGGGWLLSKLLNKVLKKQA